MKHWIIASALAALTTAAPAMAQDGPRIVAGVTAGTLGIGPEVGVRLTDHVAIRGNATFLNIGADFSSSDIDYRGDLRLKSFGGMIDIHPFGGSFRISGGARVNNNRVDVRATPSGEVSVGGEPYPAESVGVLTGGADVKKIAPALTLGWGGSRRKGFMFGFEAGVLFQGEARLREFRASGPVQNDPDFRTSLEVERRDLQDDIDKVKVYPIVQAMIGWRF